MTLLSAKKSLIENNERDRWLTDDEEKRLLENSPEWLREIISFALNTGLRQGELLSLEWSRVNLFRCMINIVSQKYMILGHSKP